MLFLSARAEPGASAERATLDAGVVGWLMACALLVFSMVILGGVTRLTGSGLSMVDWQPLKGVIPPFGEAAWQALFEQYKAFPEYRFVNRGMDLDGFRFIFLFEYAHRLLGRLIGIAFLLPMLWFWWQGRLGRALRPHLVALFCLGGLQGLLGWYMVMSGLVDDPHVSQYRLTAHLCLAVVIYGYMLLLILELLRRDPVGFMRPLALGGLPLALLLLVLLMIASGGFVAGTHAGYIYNTFPDMHGEWLPEAATALTPLWRNALDNPVAIQFNHRVLAGVVLAAMLWNLVRIGSMAAPRRRAALLLAAAGALQVTLGIVTLLHQVPVVLGAMHQAGALIVFSAAVLHYHAACFDRRQEDFQ